MRGFESRIRRIEGAAAGAAKENQKLTEIRGRIARYYERIGKPVDQEQIQRKAQFWFSSPKNLAEILSAAIEQARKERQSKPGGLI
jgi:hypothetical protein